jgi:hypothetical protein
MFYFYFLKKKKKTIWGDYDHPLGTFGVAKVPKGVARG